MNKKIDYGIYKGIGRPVGSTDYKGDRIDSMPVYGIPQTSTRNKFLLIFFGCVAFILIIELLVINIAQGMQRFYETRYFATHSIIRKEEGYKSFSLVFSLPITIEEVENPGEILRPVVEVADKEVTKTEMEIEEIVKASTNPDVARKVIDTFGIVYGPKALAIFTAESGLNCMAIGINTNRTVDLGVAQINSIHYNDEFTAKDALDCDKAIEWSERKAKEDAIASGYNQKYDFRAWVAHNNGNFLAHYK